MSFPDISLKLFNTQTESQFKFFLKVSAIAQSRVFIRRFYLSCVKVCLFSSRIADKFMSHSKLMTVKTDRLGIVSRRKS